MSQTIHAKKLIEVVQSPEPHWVGDGFRVHSLFSMQEYGQKLSPFLLLDYAAPVKYPPADKPRGVDSHPHKGFETVTIVYQGALEHRDSTGNYGKIGPGDVQWMTAASGLLHEEKHEREWSKAGGMMEMVQLWVNLPAKDKAATPGYQTLLARDIRTVQLPDDAGTLRVIAGSFDGTRGAARTFTPLNVFDVRLKGGHGANFDLPEGHNAAVVVLEGKTRFNDEQDCEAVSVAIFDPAGSTIHIAARGDARLLLLSGQPINEPIAAYGPFVMNTKEEIAQAVADFRAGKMGHLD